MDSTPKDILKKIARDAGFDLFGVCSAEIAPERKALFKKACESGFTASSKYLDANADKFFDPRMILPSARSVVVCALSYNLPEHESPPDAEKCGIISRYARGKDYHSEALDRLKIVRAGLERLFPGSENKAYADTGNISEKYFAERAGLGAQGRNTLLINPEYGSFLFLGVVISSANIEPDKAFDKDLCGACRACEKACPTSALADRFLDARKCVSYHTIENRKAEELPEFIVANNPGYLFGCDICQTVCPYNAKAKISQADYFSGRAYFELEEIEEMTQETFQAIFAGTPVERLKLAGLKRNARALGKGAQHIDWLTRSI